MEEKILGKSKQRNIKKLILGFLVLGLLVSLLIGIWFSTSYVDSYQHSKNMYWAHQDDPNCAYFGAGKCFDCRRVMEKSQFSFVLGWTLDTLWVYIPMVIVIPLALLVWLWLGRCQVTVTDRRIYGRTTWGKRFELFDRVILPCSAVRIPDGVSLMTCYGKVQLPMMENADQIYDLLRERGTCKREEREKEYVHAKSVGRHWLLYLLAFMIPAVLLIGLFVFNTDCMWKGYASTYEEHRARGYCYSEGSDGQCYRCEKVTEQGRLEYLWEESGWVVILMSSVALVMGALFYCWVGRCQMVIAEQRIYGRGPWGKKYDLPWEAIRGRSAVRLPGGVSFDTGMGKYTALNIRNAGEMYAMLQSLPLEVWPPLPPEEVSPPPPPPPPPPTKGGYVFISYSHKNEDMVRKVIRKLQKEDIEYWHDGRIVIGNPWTAEIAKAIDECDTFMLLMSSDYLASQHCEREVHFAASRKDKKELLTVYLEQVKLPLDMDMLLGPYQAIFLHDFADEEAFLDALAKAGSLVCCKRKTKEREKTE